MIEILNKINENNSKLKNLVKTQEEKEILEENRKLLELIIDKRLLMM